MQKQGLYKGNINMANQRTEQQRRRLLQSCLLALLSQSLVEASEVGNIFSTGKVTTEGCEGITAIPSFPYRIGGSTTLANMALPAAPSLLRSSNQQGSLHISCGDDSSYDIDTPGLWYSIEGHNQFILAEIETSDESRQNFALFQGSNCGEELECVLGHEQEYDNQLSWFGQEGVTYYFKVLADPKETERVFLLDLDEYTAARPVNDNLDKAIALAMGASVTGITSGAWPHGVVHEHCHLGPYSRGLFYTVEGNGEHLELSLRTDVSEGNMGVAILNGGECVAHSGHMSANDGKHTLYFPSAEGQIYTIVISGESIGDSGLFQLTIGDHAESSVASSCWMSLSCAVTAALLLLTI